MIVDKPKPKDFERQSIQYLIQSIDLITSNDHKDEDIEDYEVDMAEYWKYHQGILLRCAQNTKYASAWGVMRAKRGSEIDS